MATFSVAAGTDWIVALTLNPSGERWRLDDYDLWLQVKAPGSDTALLDLGLDSGALHIADPIARRLEINVAWPNMAPLDAGTYEFDVLMENRTTGIRVRSETNTLTITRGITKKESA